MSRLRIETIPTLEDNYTYLLIDAGGTNAVIDPAEAAPIISYIEKHDISLTYILNTHHHADHTGGNVELKQKYKSPIVGPGKERDKIQSMDTGLYDGDTFPFGYNDFEIIETPGHTLGHICFYLPKENVLFCGDTLFSLGTGRLFEGTAEDLFASLQKIKALPASTMIYCGHEYTQENAEFCLSIDPDNKALQKRYEEVLEKRELGQPTIPVSLETELATNPFLRAESAEELQKLRDQKEQWG